MGMDLLQKLEQQQKDLNDKILQEKARIKEIQRQEKEKRQSVIGKLVDENPRLAIVELSDQDMDTKSLELKEILKKYVKKKSDRKLLDLD